MTDHSRPATRELLWLSCREKTCCHNSRVIVSGRDVWRVARQLELKPWDFVRYADAVAGAADGFLLSPGGPLYQLILAKRGEPGPGGAPCIFLWRLADGHAQCGLGAWRPMVCLTYPAFVADGMLQVESSLCTCRRWSLMDLDPARDKPLLEQMLAEATEYSGLVEAWNRRLSGGSEIASFPDYCRYLMASYERLAT